MFASVAADPTHLLRVVSLGGYRGHGAMLVHQLLWPLCSKYLSGGEPPPLIAISVPGANKTK